MSTKQMSYALPIFVSEQLSEIVHSTRYEHDFRRT